MPGFDSLTHDQVAVLYDMAVEWSDRDRHGELEASYGYDAGRRSAFYVLAELINAEAKKRRITYA